MGDGLLRPSRVIAETWPRIAIHVPDKQLRQALRIADCLVKGMTAIGCEVDARISEWGSYRSGFKVLGSTVDFELDTNSDYLRLSITSWQENIHGVWNEIATQRLEDMLQDFTIAAIRTAAQ